MKKILITGAAGFIGCHLVRHLLNDINNVLVLVDNLQRGKMDKDFSELLSDKKIEFLQADLTDPNFYKTLDEDFDQVYHLAAVNGTKLFYQMPHEVLRINVLSLIYILEWIRNLGQKKPKLCFTSSNEAYAGALAAFGQLPIPTPESVPLVVSDTYNPRWSYGGTKLIGELFVIHYPGILSKSYGQNRSFCHFFSRRNPHFLFYRRRSQSHADADGFGCH